MAAVSAPPWTNTYNQKQIMRTETCLQSAGYLLVRLLPALILCAGSASAKTAWPSKPDTLVVPFVAGGGTDIGTRIVARTDLSQILGQSVIVENKGGGAAMLDMQTLRESGVTGAESRSWIGMLAPAATPKEIVDKISQNLQQAVANPDLQQQLLAQGAVAKGGTPADFAQLIAADRKRYARSIIDNKLMVD